MGPDDLGPREGPLQQLSPRVGPPFDTSGPTTAGNEPKSRTGALSALGTSEVGSLAPVAPNPGPAG